MAGIGSSGLKAWLIQRISAVYLAGFLLLAAVYMMVYPPANYKAWVQLISHPVVNSALVLFLTILLVHSWVGLRDVAMDYVKPLWLRVSILAIIAVYLVLCLVFGLRILFRVSL